MFELIGFAATIAAAGFGFIRSRSFVRRRLAYVDAVHRTGTPFLAGIAAALVAMPLVAFIPLVGGATAILFGTSVGFGVAAGSRDARHRRLGAG